MPEIRLIDANRLLEDVMESLEHNNHIGAGRAYHRQEHAHFAYMIESAPTIEAEPVKRGKWITTEKTVDDGMTTCRYCRREFYIDDLVQVGNKDGYCEFCPNCGADMRGDE